LPVTSSTSPLPFFHVLERLKVTKREGWRRHGVSGGESIADHMYRMAIMTMLAPPALAARLDVQRCTAMALVHDMAEALVGDITPVEGVSKAEKSRREAAAMAYLARDLLGNVAPGGAAGQRLQALWAEYEASETLEARFVHDVDKVELLLQMLEYERRERGRRDLSEFVHVVHRVDLPEVRQWCDELLRERESFWAAVQKPAN
jgi:putative hydrolase of HD superfamily